MKVVCLLEGALHAPELHALAAIAALPVDLVVVHADGPRPVTTLRRVRSMVAHHGLFTTLSRLLGSTLLGRSRGRAREEELERLLDGTALRAWWDGAAIATVRVPWLNAPETTRELGTIGPDIIVRLTGGILKPALIGTARIATLNIHHGRLPAIRGMWSIPWAIAEGRPDWIGASVHVVDEGIDTGAIVRIVAPQIAPGDTGTTLFFRAHLEIVAALVDVLGVYMRGEDPGAVTQDGATGSTYRSAPGLGAWLRYVWYQEGRRSPMICRTAYE